jgi:hypothetical protein
VGRFWKLIPTLNLIVDCNMLSSKISTKSKIPGWQLNICSDNFGWQDREMLSDAILENGPAKEHTDRYYFVSWHSLNSILDEPLTQSEEQLVRAITVYKFDSVKEEFSLYCMSH